MAIWSWFLENQTKFSFYGILIIEILVNSLCFAWADSLLGDFLEGSIGKSKARKLRKQQKLRVKLLMNYITPVLRRHQKTFRKYLRLYHAWLFSRIVPLGMIISYLMIRTPYQLVVLIIDIIVTCVIEIVFRAPSWPGGTSFYSGRKNIK